MFVTRRRYERDLNLAKVRYEGESLLSELREGFLISAESALEHKDWQIEKLQDDLYRMHDHMMYVREVMADLP